MSFNSPRRLTAEQFAAAVPVLQAKRKRISDDRIEAARRTMVLGEKADDVATSYGWSRNAVSICVRKVWDVAEQMRLDAEGLSADGLAVGPVSVGSDVLPAGWHRRTFIAPEHLLDKWTQELETLFRPAVRRADQDSSVIVVAAKTKPAVKKTPAAKKTNKKK